MTESNMFDDLFDDLFDSVDDFDATVPECERSKKEKKLTKEEIIQLLEKTGEEYTGIHPDTLILAGDDPKYSTIYPTNVGKLAKESGCNPTEVMMCGREYADWVIPKDDIFVLNINFKPEKLTMIKYTDMRPCMRIYLEDGYEIICGIHQKFLVRDISGSVTWKMAKDIVDGDDILSPGYSE